MHLCYHRDKNDVPICNISQLARAIEAKEHWNEEKKKLQQSATIYITTFNVYPTVEDALLDVSNLE